MPAARPKKKVIALTGVHGFTGARLLRELVRDVSVTSIVVFDTRPPGVTSKKIVFQRVDLREPACRTLVRDTLTRTKADCVVHAAFTAGPTHDTRAAHELDTIGTLHVLDAVAATKVKKFILCSTAMRYGAGRDNPNYLRESHAARTDLPASIADKVEAERQTERFLAEHPDRYVMILRPATIIGPTVQSFVTRYLSRRVATTVLGHDPLVQFLHEDDWMKAILLAIDKNARGPFNLAGDGVLALSRVFALAGAVTLPLPHGVAKSWLALAWAARLVEAPPSFVDYLRDLCVVDTARARQTLGFDAQWSSKDALIDFLGSVRARRVVRDDARAHAGF